MPKVQFQNGTLSVKKGSFLDKALKNHPDNFDNFKKQERLGVNFWDVGARFHTICKSKNITPEVGLDLFKQYLDESIIIK